MARLRLMSPLVAFNFSGPANHGTPGYYKWDYKNLGPRVALAWSPSYDSGVLGDVFGGAGKSSLRAGFGIVYDRIGEGLLDTFDQNGSFGLSTNIPNAAASETVACTPRVTSLAGPTAIPQTDNCGAPIFVPAPTRELSSALSEQSRARQRGDHLGSGQPPLRRRTPTRSIYPFSANCPAGFTLRRGYVGRLSHRLLAQDDLAMPLDPYDKKAGMDYFTAATALAKIYRQQLAAGNGTPTNSFNSEHRARECSANTGRTLLNPGSSGRRLPDRSRAQPIRNLRR